MKNSLLEDFKVEKKLKRESDGLQSSRSFEVEDLKLPENRKQFKSEVPHCVKHIDHPAVRTMSLLPQT